MRRLFQMPLNHLALALALGDFAVLWGAGQSSSILWHRLHPEVANYASSWQLPAFICLCLISCGAMMVERFSARGQMLVRVLAGVSLGAVLVGIGHLILPIPLPPARLHVATLLVAVPLLCLARLTALWLLDQPAFTRRLVVLGSDAAYARVAGIVAQRPGWTLVGHLPTPSDQDYDSGYLLAALMPLAPEVLIFAHEHDDPLPIRTLVDLRRTGAQIWDISRFIEQEIGRVDVHWLPAKEVFLAQLSSPEPAPAEAVRHLLDRCLALVLLIALSPLLAAVFLAIRMESAGPALFWQERVGQFGQRFRLVKLRSMMQHAEADGQARWAEEDDPRITRLGRFLRQFHIDELPQLWNILRGEMRFVGPRPERPEFVSQLEAEIPFYAVRHHLRPGITGWAQINYPYAASLEDARAKLEYDLFYIKHAHFLLDAFILLQTARVLLWRRGAR